MEKNKTRVRVGRGVYFTLSAIFAMCVIVQVFLAGMGTFVNPAHWSQHVTFIHLFGFNLPLFMLLAAFVGSLPRWAYWQLFAVLILIFAMYFTANMTSLAAWLGAMHPVIALLLTAVACSNVLKSGGTIFKKQEGGNKI